MLEMATVTYQRDYGDTLAFMIITDRVPILVGIAAVFFGFRSTTMPVAFAFLIGIPTRSTEARL